MTTKHSKREATVNRSFGQLMTTLLTILALSFSAEAQTFNSGSDGSDGALSLTTAGTYTFDPNDAGTFGRILDADGDGVYNFTTINIAPGVILKIPASKVSRPIYWLVSGAVTIAGQIDLSGQGNMPTTTILDQRRIASVPGAGGYPGGVGGFGSVPSQPGQGPGGGAAGTSDTNGKGGTFSGNRFLVPLVGGSGGGGAGTVCFVACCFGPAGGAGGGAIAIISSASISVSDSIKADGGAAVSSGCSPGVSGGGSGGAIRLAAPVISGNGTLSVVGLTCCPDNGAYSNGGPGQVRVEAFCSGSGEMRHFGGGKE